MTLVPADADLITMSPWRGVHVLTPTRFAGRVDGMRRPSKPHWQPPDQGALSEQVGA